MTSLWGALLDAEVEERQSRRREIVGALSAHEHVYHYVDFDREDDYDVDEEHGDVELAHSAAKARSVEPDPARASVFSSALVKTWSPDIPEMDDRLHTVAVDIDVPIKVIPSSTEGHGHLYIDKVMPWRDYLKLLRVMAEVGLVEPGYVAASERRGATHLRMPWIKKDEAPF